MKSNSSKKRAYSTFLGCLILSGTSYGTFAVLSNYSNDLAQKLGSTVSAVTVMFAVLQVATLLTNLSLPYLLKKLSMKQIILVGAIFYSVFFFLAAIAKTILVLYIGAFFYGIGLTLAGFVAIQIVIPWWFTEGVGKKISLTSVVYSIFGLVISPVIMGLINKIGVTNTLLINGVFCIVLLVLSAILISEHPSKYGLTAYGPESKPEEHSLAEENKPALSLAVATKTKALWFVFLAYTFGCFATAGYGNSAANLYQRMGLSPMSAATMISINCAAAIAWSFLFGLIFDKIGGRKSCTIFVCIGIISFIIYLFSGGFLGALVFSIILGSTRFMGMYGASVLPYIFGKSNISNLLPMVFAGGALGSIISPLVSGRLLDLTGNYTVFTLVLIAGMVVMLVFHLLGTRKQYK